jgi:hypothetical protein
MSLKVKNTVDVVDFMWGDKFSRAKKNLPKIQENVRLVDHVTKHNMGLITRLRNCKELESPWYFNCSVYGKTFDEKRIKFDIFDDINNKIAQRQ